MVSSSSSSSTVSALLTLRYASLQDVAQDLDMVIQSSSQGEWAWEGASAQEQHRWIDFVHDPMSVSEASTAGLAGKVQVTEGVSLTFSLLSRSRLEEKGRDAVVDVSAPTLAAADVARLQAALIDRSRQWADEGIDSLFLFDLVTTAQTLAAELTAPSTPHADPAPSSAETPRTHIELARALFWSHHLKAPSKLKDFNSWCPELGVWSIVRVGYPGYLCFEGEAAAVDDMVTRVKALQWHALQLRVHKRWIWTSEEAGRSAEEQALLSCALARGHADNVFAGQGGEVKVRTGCEVIENLGELVTRLRKCNLDEDEIEEALGIRMSSSTQ
ncbi:conserved hypothetical protein [Sporisorium reilianum SRZ2]|uniref:Uncharacterized protein n=1 Tax=Sporisorium reilianum (strain SRZ2) TaxID=999809 RepID=E6ZKG2_SPORE|nr:conserved hypothetical protein [Sporisorium reilianum SRZ2]